MDDGGNFARLMREVGGSRVLSTPTRPMFNPQP